MKFLLDTNVISEAAAPRPDPLVLGWLDGTSVADTFLSSVTLAEVRRGIDASRAPARRQRLEQWFASLKTTFLGRIVAVDEGVGEAAGRILARCDHAGRPGMLADALIAATAEVHALALVTRNLKDFEVWGGPVVNPWEPR